MGVWKTIQRCCLLVHSNLSFVVGNGQRIKFWKALGSEFPPFMSLIPICMLWQLQRRLGRGITGESLRMEEAGTLFSLDLSMIGKLRRRRGSCVLLGDRS